uniref:Uncharacterized protein n=1 Tax=Cacopsylla melanoneura TaxID=428564 RepID=A0A8D9BA65_9HEMI
MYHDCTLSTSTFNVHYDRYVLVCPEVNANVIWSFEEDTTLSPSYRYNDNNRIISSLHKQKGVPLYYTLWALCLHMSRENANVIWSLMKKIPHSVLHVDIFRTERDFSFLFRFIFEPRNFYIGLSA